MNLSADYHDSHRFDLNGQMRGANSIIRLTQTFSSGQVPMIFDLLAALAVLYYLFGAYMAFIIACTLVVFIWTNKKMVLINMRLQRTWLHAYDEQRDHLTETSTQWTTVTYANRTEQEIERNRTLTYTQEKRSQHLELSEISLHAVKDFTLLAGLASACILAIWQIKDGSRRIGDFVVLLTYWAELSNLSSISSTATQIVRDLVDTEELLKLMQRIPSVREQPNAKPLKVTNGAVTFENVSFSYDGSRQILRNITIPGNNASRTIAIVGPTGSGKSTLFRLLTRLYDLPPFSAHPSDDTSNKYENRRPIISGTIKIDSQDIRTVTLTSLRSAIAVVPQSPALFNTTILANLLYANPSASLAEAQDACRAAALHDTITTKFPQGYDTVVGGRGAKLSGGEVQRLAIARALLQKDARILLLDEATGSVDGETEARIQEGVRRKVREQGGRTTLVIAHRLATVRDADWIYVVKDGEVVEQGVHEELVRMVGGCYWRMWTRSLGDGGGDLKADEDKNETEGGDSAGEGSSSKEVGTAAET
ncbi:MAG: hypothetical protein Q9227_003492 [Pyrenula ochraceoflavens]